MVTLINASTPVTRPAELAPEDHLTLSMHDIVEELPDMTPPGDHHIEALLAFARALGPPGAAAHPLLCRRQPLDRRRLHGRGSTGADRDEAELAATMRGVASATP